MIDEKGRLFGKLNIIDLLAILAALVVLVVLAVHLAGRSAAEGASPTPSPSPTVDPGPSVIEYTVKYSRMDPALYQQIKESFDRGDRKFMTNGGFEVEGSEVVALRAEPYVATVLGEDGKIVVKDDPYYLDVYFTARSETSNAVTNRVNTQEARIGRTFIIKTRDYEVAGLIVACDRVDGQR